MTVDLLAKPAPHASSCQSLGWQVLAIYCCLLRMFTMPRKIQAVMFQAEKLLVCRSLISLFPKAEPDVSAAKAAAASLNAAPTAQEAAANGTSSK